ncbi:MAG: hypothetical protein HY901_28040 [Deltaproteobacteria bacterium]|nr:hypothetical protein [Deltaproteobacteria bacterium]
MSSAEHRAELFATVLMALSSILTAWATFQSAKWSGLQAKAYDDAEAARVSAARLSGRADQLATLDANLFLAWSRAVESEEGAQEVARRGYRPAPASLAQFLSARFRPEFRVAFEAWLSTNPFTNPDAPRSPFEMPEYRRKDEEEAARQTRMGEERVAAARSFNLRSDRYVATAVVFSMVLFFAGVGPKLEGRLARGLMLGLSVLFLVGGASILATFPVALD